MYPHTIAGLFDAVAKGILADVEEVINSKKIDINQPHLEMHIINFAFIRSAPQLEEKINILIKSGAIPVFNAHCNILSRLSGIKNKELLDKIINLIRKKAEFVDIYTQQHFDAMSGIPPRTQDEAFKTDYFGLYPIHYALFHTKADKSWFEKFNYDLITPIKDGLYEGANFIIFLVGSKLFDDLIYFLLNLSPVQRYQMLKAGPLSVNSHACGVTVAWLFLLHKRYDDFTRLTEGLTVEQRFEILKSAPSNVNHKGYGITVALQLLFDKRYEDFTRLTQGLTVEQGFEILKSAPSNVNHKDYGITVAWLLLIHKRYEDFTRLMEGLSVEQRFELLKSAPSNVNHNDYGVTVLDQLLEQKQFNIIEMLVKGLSLVQFFELLLSQGRPIENIKLTSFNYFLKTNEALLTKILESFEKEDLVKNLYDKLESEHEGLALVSIVILEKINISLRGLFKSQLNENEEINAQIKNEFENLLNIYDQLAGHLKYGKKASEMLGMTICEACCSKKLKKICVSVFENTKETNRKTISDYLYIKARDPLNAMEGYGHYLRVLGCENEEQSKLLGVAYAEAKSNKKNSMLNNNLTISESVSAAAIQMPPAPESTNDSAETRALKERIELLEKQVRQLKRRPDSVADEVTNAVVELTSEEPIRQLKRKPNFESDDRSTIIDEVTIEEKANQESDLTPMVALMNNTIFKQGSSDIPTFASRTRTPNNTRAAKRRAP